MKKCKWCKWRPPCRVFAGILRPYEDIEPDNCHMYKRKWWLIGRPK